MQIRRSKATLYCAVGLFVFFLILGCKTDPTLQEKIENASDNELLYFLNNGNVQQRRLAAFRLKNNSAKEFFDEITERFLNDEDEIVAAYCAYALAKISDKKSIDVLADAALALDGVRAETAANALAYAKLTDYSLSKIRNLLAKKPATLDIFLNAYSSFDSEKIRQLWLEILNNSKKYPSRAIERPIRYMGAIKETRANDAIYRIYFG